ncbi:hypothetical protein Bbelb_165970 [Branchiostoma belcheri]|nr:hypothetical protein Bbelb_165970 [Branchiostoma belcheri]
MLLEARQRYSQCSNIFRSETWRTIRIFLLGDASASSARFLHAINNPQGRSPSLQQTPQAQRWLCDRAGRLVSNRLLRPSGGSVTGQGQQWLCDRAGRLVSNRLLCRQSPSLQQTPQGQRWLCDRAGRLVSNRLLCRQSPSLQQTPQAQRWLCDRAGRLVSNRLLCRLKEEPAKESGGDYKHLAIFRHVTDSVK